MHRIRLAILLFLCVSAAGCQPVPGVLLDAEAIVMEHPDSAARLLEGVPAPEKRLSRRNYAHYALVLTQARWLAGENMIDDTLSDVALDYYRTHTDDFAAAHKAYYYAAKIAHQRRQPEVAMTLLLKSRDMLPPKGEWRRHYVVETWLGVFCGQQHLFEEKIRHAQQADETTFRFPGLSGSGPFYTAKVGRFRRRVITRITVRHTIITDSAAKVRRAWKKALTL